MDELKINPEFKDAIPPLGGEEYSALRESIKHDGCRDAIIVWDGTIVDGMNRYSICKELNVPFATVEKAFKDDDAAMEFIIFNQLARRNLTDVVRGRLALKLKIRIAARAKQNQGTRTDILTTLSKSEPVHTRKKLAEIAGLSEGTLAKIEKVDKDAPVVISDAMGKKIISINKAAMITNHLKDLPEEERETETEAFLMPKCTSDRHRKWYEKSVVVMLDFISNAATNRSEYICADCVDIYIRRHNLCIASLTEALDVEMEWLGKLKQLIIDRDNYFKSKGVLYFKTKDD